MRNKVFIHAFGCQMNKLDAELALSALRRAGYEQVASPDEADVILYNTCSVREHAEERVYSNVGKLKHLKQRKPDLVIGILGCMAQKDGEKIFTRLPHVDLVCGTSRAWIRGSTRSWEFPRVAELIEEARRADQSRAVRRTLSVLACGAERAVSEARDQSAQSHQERAAYPRACGRTTRDTRQSARDISVRPNRHRAYVGIMRGCDNYCAYCVVPYLRGREISRPLDEIADEAKRLVDDGCREITLLGQNVNGYGKRFDHAIRQAHGRERSRTAHRPESVEGSFGRPGALVDLLSRLDKLAGLARVRFVTSHPKDMSREILQAVRDLPTVCEHLHMPAQSGSDRVLAAMNRKYAAKEYRELVALARELVPGIAIASDFIVGFPGETEAEFEETASLVRELRFQNIFVFKYSPRPGTAAAKLFADDVPQEEKKRRNLALLDIQSHISLEENRKLIGREVEVLIEGASRRDPSRVTGRLRTNHIAVCEGPEKTLAGELVRVRIASATALTLEGRRTGR